MLGFYLFNDTFPTHSPEPPSPPELQPAPLEQHLTMVQNYTKRSSNVSFDSHHPPKQMCVSDLKLHTDIGSTIGQGVSNVKQKILSSKVPVEARPGGPSYSFPRWKAFNDKPEMSSARWKTQLDISTWPTYQKKMAITGNLNIPKYGTP